MRINGVNEPNIVGFNSHRLNTSDDYHTTEVKLNEQFNKMDLNTVNQAVFGVNQFGEPKDFLSIRELTIVASLIQWLGTPCGKSFLEESGFEYKGVK
jgi:hypothetical protein